MNWTVRPSRAVTRAGFTLIEVLLVVAILGILAGVVVGAFAGRQKDSMIKATRMSIKNICTAVETYEVDTGRFPSSLDNLMRSSGEPNWNGPYLKGSSPADSWGTPFSYSLQGENDFSVKSAGPDLQMGSDDDITN